MLQLLKVVFWAGGGGQEQCSGRGVGVENCLQSRETAAWQRRVGMWSKPHLKDKGNGKWGFRVSNRARYRRLPQK